MTPRTELRPDLDLQIARVHGVPAVRRALDMLADAAKSHAPGCRVWVTMQDERVRPAHRDADGQAIPDNLRFRLDGANGGTDLARHPRDPNLPIENRANCRCTDPPLPQLLAESIHATDVSIVGTRVSGSVETRFPRAAESEFGGDGDEGAYYMTRALEEVAARLRAGHAR